MKTTVTAWSKETAMKSERFVLVLHGSVDKLTKTKGVLKNVEHDVQAHSV